MKHRNFVGLDEAFEEPEIHLDGFVEHAMAQGFLAREAQRRAEVDEMIARGWGDGPVPANWRERFGPDRKQIAFERGRRRAAMGKNG